MNKFIAAGIVLLGSLFSVTSSTAQEDPCFTKEEQLQVLVEALGEISIVLETDDAIRYSSPSRPETDLVVVFDDDGCALMGLVVPKEPTIES